MLKLIIKIINKIFNLSIGSIIKLIYNIFTKNKTVKSFALLFKWLSILFTILYLIRDTKFIAFLPPLYFMDYYFNLVNISKLKVLWDKLLEWLIKLFEGLKTTKPNKEIKFPQPWLVDSPTERVDFVDSDQLDLKKRKRPQVKIGDGYGHEWDVDKINVSNRIWIALLILASGVMVVSVVSDSIREMVTYPITTGFAAIWYVAKIPMKRLFNVIDHIKDWLKFFDKDPKGPKPNNNNNDLDRVMEDDIEGIEGDPDGQYKIISGELKIQRQKLELNFKTADTIFNYNSDDEEEEGEKTPVRSGNNSPQPATVQPVASTSSTVTLDQPKASSSTLHADITEVSRSGSRSPVHTNHPELDDLVRGNTRRFWDDTNFDDLFDVFK